MSAPFTNLMGSLASLESVIADWPDLIATNASLASIAAPRIIPLPALWEDKTPSPDMLRVATIEHPIELGPPLVAMLEAETPDDVDVIPGFYLRPA